MAPRDHPGWDPARLRRVRTEHGHTQESLAEAINNVQVPGFRPPYASPDAVSDHENGRHYPTRIYREAYRHVFGRTDHELGFAGPAGTVASVQRGAAHPSGYEHQGGDATHRRGFISVTALVLGATPAGAPLTSDDRLAALGRTASAAGAVTAAEGHLGAAVGDYLTQPPAAVLARLAAVQQLTDAIQAEYLLPPADTARLWKAAGIAAGLRGWLENNAGDTTAARSSLREAHRRGELIDDSQLTAWARYMQAVVEVYAGVPATAERYAADGLRQLRRAGSKGRPLRAQLLVDHIAEARANRGDLDGVETTIAEAHAILTALPPEQHGPPKHTIIDSIEAFNPLYFAESAGRAYARLGRPDRFAEVTADVRQATDPAGTHLDVLFRLDEALAVTRSRDPDLEAVAALTREGLALADLFQTGNASNRLRLILDAAKPFATHRAIVDLTEYGTAWRSDRLARLAAKTTNI